jgi:signal transduction histidine kinase
MRVLIIDDDELDRRAIKRALKRSGLTFEVHEASDARSGIALAQASSFDCVLLDFRLPDMDGLAVVKKLAELNQNVAPAIVMLTGEGDEHIAVEALKSGIQDYLPKSSLTEAALGRAISTAVNLVDAQNQITELNRQKDRFYSILAHDLKSPFNALLGFSSMIAESAKNASREQLADWAQSFHQATEQVYDLLESLLEWSQLQRHEISYDPRDVNLHELIEGNRSLLAPLAAKKRIELASDVVPTLSAYGDQNMIDAVLRNLIANAIKFTETDGIVSILAKEDDDWVRVSVIDNGIGVSPERINRLFVLGEKTSTAGTEGEKGTGFGLLLCDEYVRKQGGKLLVESTLGEGSAFHFTLPIAPG